MSACTGDVFTCTYANQTMYTASEGPHAGERGAQIGNFWCPDDQNYLYTIYKYYNEDHNKLKYFVWGKEAVQSMPYNYKVELSGNSNPAIVTDNILGPYNIVISGLKAGETLKFNTDIKASFGTITNKEGGELPEIKENGTIEVYLKVDSVPTGEIELSYTPTEGYTYGLTYHLYTLTYCPKGKHTAKHQDVAALEPSRNTRGAEKLPLPVPKEEKTPDIMLLKEDETGKDLKGARFDIKVIGTEGVVKEYLDQSVSPQFRIDLGGLSDGRYKIEITEIKAPAGYIKPDNVVEVHIQIFPEASMLSQIRHISRTEILRIAGARRNRCKRHCSKLY